MRLILILLAISYVIARFDESPSTTLGIPSTINNYPQLIQTIDGINYLLAKNLITGDYDLIKVPISHDPTKETVLFLPYLDCYFGFLT